MARKFFLVLQFLYVVTFAQQPGTKTPEVHPTLTSERCTISGGCVTVNTSIVLEASFRDNHEVNGTANCYDSGFNSSICTDVSTCGKNCAYEGADYSSYGVKAEGDTLTLNLFTQRDNITREVAPRVYLLANDTTYDMLMLLNRELTFDVEMVDVPCGTNSALYLSEMEATGASSELNRAGAAYGTGYCDAQCPKQAFVNGEANLNGIYGSCCNEMDIWESNNAATAYTPHSCNVTGTYACSGDLCSSSGVCDQAGCDFNPYRMGNKRFYGPDSTNIVDTSRKVTVVTQFHTTDNTSTGTLSAISRVYIQDGIVIANSAVNITNMEKQTPIDDEYCDAELATFGGSGAFQRQGGMAQIGDALGRGMVLVFSIWMDHGESGMLWLDGTFPLTSNGTELGSVRGPCGQTSGNNTMITNTYPDAKVVFSAIKVGELGSTFGHVSQGNDSIWLIQGR